MAVAVIASVLVMLIVILLARISGGTRASRGAVVVGGNNTGVISTGTIVGDVSISAASTEGNPGGTRQSPRTADTIVAVIGILVAVAGVIVAVIAWLYPREPEAHHRPTAAVYYRGHGAQVCLDPDAPGQNLLIPIGSRVQERFELASGAVPLR
jgi:hypothetical protein